MRYLLHHLRRAQDLRIVRFCLQSLTSFGLNFGLTALLHEGLGAPPELAFLLALVVVFVVNFLTMRYYVYRAAAGHGGRQLTLFAVSSLVFRSGEWLAFLVVHTWLGAPPYPTLLGVLVASFVVKYLYYGLVFRNPTPKVEAGGDAEGAIVATSAHQRS